MMKYLAYGSNLHPARLQQRVPSANLQGVTVLQGWRLNFHKRSEDGSGKCSIEHVGSVEPATAVHAAVFLIDPEEKPDLDRVEGVGCGYYIEFLEVPGFGDVFTYIASPDYIDIKLQPYQWYRHLVLAGCHFHGFPESYRQMIAEVESRADPNEARHGENMKIIQDDRSKPLSR